MGDRREVGNGIEGILGGWFGGCIWVVWTVRQEFEDKPVNEDQELWSKTVSTYFNGGIFCQTSTNLLIIYQLGLRLAFG